MQRQGDPGAAPPEGALSRQRGTITVRKSRAARAQECLGWSLYGVGCEEGHGTDNPHKHAGMPSAERKRKREKKERERERRGLIGLR